MLKFEITTRETNSMPFLVFRRDHLRSTSGIICGSGSYAAQFGDHFRSGDYLRSGIICGAVQIKQASEKRSSDGAHAWGEQKIEKKWGGGEPEGRGWREKESFPPPHLTPSLCSLFFHTPSQSKPLGPEAKKDGCFRRLRCLRISFFSHPLPVSFRSRIKFLETPAGQAKIFLNCQTRSQGFSLTNNK